MNDEERNELKDILNDLDRDITMPPYNTGSERGYSREYKEYKREEEKEREQSRYERLCVRSSKLLGIKADESIQKKLNSPLSLLGWDISPSMVLSASIGVSFGAFALWAMLFVANIFLGSVIPLSIMMIMGLVALATGAYIFFKPIYAAKNKVIRSSGEMILAVLYMVIYMRSSPNLEGAIRFAALNLEGPISDDLKGILWDVEVGKYNNVEKSMEKYTRVWKDYNDDFLESLQLIKAAVNEPNKDRREGLLQDSIDRILDGTQEKMKHYAQGLKTPVMILNAMGAMLPVLGMIMLPLISVFMGESISTTHLFLVFNILLPGFLYWFMQRILSSRPPTVRSQPVSEDSLPERWRYEIELFGEDYSLPVWPVGLLIFLIVGLYGLVGYLIFPEVYPVSAADIQGTVPTIFGTADSLSPLAMLLRSLSITTGAGLGIGIAAILGNRKRKKAEEELQKIEKQFPTALFQLGNKISGGTPIELALEQAAESASDLEISNLFKYSSRNIREMGMTFEKAVFDETYGALKQFPSQMIHTVMKAILKSSDKGTTMASMAMVTISNYLENIHKTQENLNDLMEETTTTILMLAYLLAPVVSGIAVGMSQTIITAMFSLSTSFEQSVGGGSLGAGGASQYTGILGNLENAISPEVLQFVVGIYLIQLLWILGTFYMKITHGENKTYRNMFIGKVLISGMIFYSMTLLIISLLFGGMVSGIT